MIILWKNLKYSNILKIWIFVFKLQKIHLWGDEHIMIKKLAWNTFKNTGNIDTYLEIVKLEDLEKN